MYLNAVGGSFLKAQVLNRYEKTRCELYKGDIARRRIQAMTGINKSYRDAQDSLRSIRAHSGYCGEMHRTGALQVLGGKKEITAKTADKRQKRAMDKMPDTTSAGDRTELHNKSLDSEESVVRNISARKPLHSAAAAAAWREEKRELVYDMNEDIQKDETLLRDETPAKRNLSSNIKGAKTPNTDTRAKKTNSHFQDSHVTEIRRSPTTAAEGKTAPTATKGSSTPHEEGQRPGKTILQYRKPQKAPENQTFDRSALSIGKDEAKRVRGHTAPENASRLKLQVKSASLSMDCAERSSRGKYLLNGDIKKLKIHVSLSRTERQRILQELILNSTVPFDRSALEKERQRSLREKISRYFELLFEQSASDPSNDEDNALYDD